MLVLLLFLTCFSSVAEAARLSGRGGKVVQPRVRPVMPVRAVLRNLEWDCSHSQNCTLSGNFVQSNLLEVEQRVVAFLCTCELEPELKARSP